MENVVNPEFIPEVTIDLELYVWPGTNAEYTAQLPKNVIPHAVYAGNDEDVAKYCYCYCFKNGTPLADSIYLQADTLVRVEVATPKSDLFKILGCMINADSTGQIINLQINHAALEADYKVALAQEPTAHRVSIVDFSSNPMQIHCRPKNKGKFKLTFLVLMDDVIIPCDPEFDDEGEIDGP